MVHATRTSQRRPPFSNRTCRFPTSGLPKGRRSKACVERAWQGPFAPRALTPLQRYYEPLRLPIEPKRGYGFPHLVDNGLRAKRRSNGSLRFLILSASAVPSTPESPAAAGVRCFTVGIRLHPIWKGW